MKFRIASGYGKNVILLRKDSWDDFGYKTTFHAKYCDNKGIEYELGTVKIAKYDMGDRRNIDSFLPTEFDSLQDGFFSLWQTAEA